MIKDATQAILRAKKEFPDYTLETAYEGALPLHLLRITGTVLLTSDLSVPARFVLRAVSVGVDSVADISGILGLTEEEMAAPGAELLSGGLLVEESVFHRQGKRLKLTEEGHRVLNEARKLLVPRRMAFKLHFNALTNILEPVDNQTLRMDQVAGAGIFTLPVLYGPPQLASLDLSTVRSTLQDDRRLSGGGELVELLKLEDPYVEYRPEVVIVVLRDPESGSRRIAALKGRRYLVQESAGLQRLLDDGRDIIPEDAKLSSAPGLTLFPPSATEAERSAISKMIELEYDRHNLELDLTERQSSALETPPTEELKEQLRTLNEKYSEVQRELKERTYELQRETRGALRVLETEEHRQVLIRALQEASQEVIIVSPWLNPRTVDDDLCKYFASALLRGVRIRIAWGLGAVRRGPEWERNRNKARPVINRLRKLERSDQLLEIQQAETHEKILICDTKFGALGSYNWLSYRGEIDSEYRRESSSYSERPSDVVQWKNRALELFPA